MSRTKIIFPRDRVSRESSPSAEGRSSSHFLFLYLPLLLGLCALELSPTPELPHDVRRLNLSVESLLTHVLRKRKDTQEKGEGGCETVSKRERSAKEVDL